MARKKSEGIFEMLMEAPWWLGVIGAVVFYVTVGVVLPITLSGSPLGSVLAGVCPILGKGLAIACLLAAGVSAVRVWSRGRLLDGQQGLDSIRSLSWREFEHLVGEAYQPIP